MEFQIGNQVSSKRELTYSDIWIEWNKKFIFGEKGEMSLGEAKSVHSKWRSIGKMVKAGRY